MKRPLDLWTDLKNQFNNINKTKFFIVSSTFKKSDNKTKCLGECHSGQCNQSRDQEVSQGDERKSRENEKREFVVSLSTEVCPGKSGIYISTW